MFSSRALTRGARVAAPRAPLAARTAVRTYAEPAPAKSSQHVKPPLELFGVDGTYATAVYTAASKSSTLEPTARALSSLATTFRNDPKLVSLIGTPALSHEDRSQIVQELLKQSGASAKEGETVKGLLSTMAENNRLSALEGVCGKFAQLMSAHRGEVELRVTSAAQLDSKVIRQLEQAVSKSKYVGQGQKLKTVTHVRPDIRGGLIVEVGDRTIDLSVASKMSKMNKLLTDTL